MITAILAGGLAKRMRPLTETIPKSLLMVAEKPFLEHQLALLKYNGFSEIVLCLGFLGDQIQALFGDGRKYGVDIAYSFDGETLLGTGGAIRKALPLLGKSFFVMYGDSYLPVNFSEVATAFHKSGKGSLMTVYKNENLYDRSNVLFEDGAIKLYDKNTSTPEMRYIDYGLSVFNAKVFEGLDQTKSLDLANLQQDLSRRGDLAGYEAMSRFFEIGSHVGLGELDQFLRHHDSPSDGTRQL